MKRALKQYSSALRAGAAPGRNACSRPTGVPTSLITTLEQWFKSDIFQATRCCFGQLEPIVEDGEILVLRGWLFGLDSPLKALYIGIDPQKLQPALVFGQERPDIGALFPGEDQALHSGFGAVLACATQTDHLELHFRASFANQQSACGQFAKTKVLRFSGHPYFELNPADKKPASSESMSARTIELIEE
ncbi:MAG: hypothetical protein K1X83_11390 [Oligoflexia bacterium]|nr:hypothetical protein [Oligoflexia bacterium]